MDARARSLSDDQNTRGLTGLNHRSRTQREVFLAHATGAHSGE
jgi:hypothetical protein